MHFQHIHVMLCKNSYLLTRSLLTNDFSFAYSNYNVQVFSATCVSRLFPVYKESKNRQVRQLLLLLLLTS